MLEVNERIRVPEHEFEWSFVRASGPGGQNVNKVASKAVLRWPVVASPSLPADVKERLLAQQHQRITTEGELVLSSQRFRDQPQNIADCLAKLRNMIVQAVHRPKKRRPTRPTRGSREARLHQKKRRSAIKSARRVSGDD